MDSATRETKVRDETDGSEFVAVDLHSDILLDVIERRRVHEEANVLVTQHCGALHAGRVKVLVLPIYIEMRYQPESSLRMALLQVASLYQELREGNGEFRQIFKATDLERTLDSDAIGVILAFEGGEPLGRDIELVSVFYRLGLRMLGLTWNWANLLAQGTVEDTGAGLSLIGQRLVRELGRVGIILDVSHLSERSFWDVMEYSTGPVLASHSNAKAIRDNPRNISDDQIKALAERDGLIGLNFVPKFVGHGELLERLSEHAAHIASLVGVRHVALGPDFVDYLAATGRYQTAAPASQRHIAEPELEYPTEFPSARLLPAFYAELLRRGFSKPDAKAMMGGNAIRFLKKHL